jgi:hypothetical protein
MGFRGVFGIEVERRHFQRSGEACHAFFLPHRGTPVPPASYSRSLRLKVSAPGVIGVTIRAIVVHGELREKGPRGTQCGGGLND